MYIVTVLNVTEFTLYKHRVLLLLSLSVLFNQLSFVQLLQAGLVASQYRILVNNWNTF